jgi:hypothetical protein
LWLSDGCTRHSGDSGGGNDGGKLTRRRHNAAGVTIADSHDHHVPVGVL